ncbi:hypothetical protein B0H21DRAFT_752379 [Amylocystis lapponica]|nr:hypothetical protein B0H21DRAFT_752379 [Amylocystis lapponica]
MPQPATVAPRRAPLQAVPDDWDEADDDEEEDQQQIWEDANKKMPMPELVISGSSITSTAPPPTAAFQPALRILKRPTASQTSSSSSANTLTDTQKSYAEREAQYQAARERIFQDNLQNRPITNKSPNGAHSSQGDTDAMPPSGSAVAVKVVRNPRGPTVDNGKVQNPAGGQPRGFVSRRGARGTQGRPGA